MLHVFPGPDDRICLTESLANIVPGLQLVEFDMSCNRGSDADETLRDAWDKIREILCKGAWLLYCTLPARTFSRARHTRPGPRRSGAANILMVSRGFGIRFRSKFKLTMTSFFRPSKVRLHVVIITATSFWSIPSNSELHLTMQSLPHLGTFKRSRT